MGQKKVLCLEMDCGSELSASVLLPFFKHKLAEEIKGKYGGAIECQVFLKECLTEQGGVK